MSRRMLDGSDDPLGIAALAALAFIGWRHRGHLRQSPRPAWFFSALALMAMADITVEWPATWQGQSLRPLALSDVERRFAQGFPGKIARLTNGRETLVWRHVTRPTRMLHPAADCYRALGWRIRDEQLEQVKNAEQSERWRCFIAGKGQENTLRVCEHIKDSAGQGFTDASAWYWAAVTGQSVGSWRAITVASLL